MTCLKIWSCSRVADREPDKSNESEYDPYIVLKESETVENLLKEKGEKKILFIEGQ